MFDNKKCGVSSLRLDGTNDCASNEQERARLAALKCPNKSKLTYRKSVAPLSSSVIDAALNKKNVWLHDHVLDCERCGAEVTASFARTDLEPPSQVSVRSKPRQVMYMIQHLILPTMVFQNPSDSMHLLIADPQGANQILTQLAEIDPSIGLIGETHDIDIDALALGVCVEFASPRATGEAFYAFIGLRDGNAAPDYYLCEQTYGDEHRPFGKDAVLTSWSADKSGNPDMHANFGALDDSEIDTFLDAVFARYA